MNINLLKKEDLADPARRNGILAMLENSLKYKEEALAMFEANGLTIKPYMLEEVGQMRAMIKQLKEMP